MFRTFNVQFKFILPLCNTGRGVEYLQVNSWMRWRTCMWHRTV